ncbi:MAG: recombinase family protein [Actinobacteria bacterium]|nr:recombinase family protein [Actinomycetota bacterium]
MNKPRAALYARLSVSREESVSIERQLASGHAYAESHGWEVVLEAVDDGVSATRNKPQDRDGWSSLLNSPTSYDHVIIWKIDRLARKVIDFVVADEALQKRGAGLVSIKESLDLSTDIGRMIAMILATFAQMEAKAIGERGADARRFLVNAGRRAGGRTPYGYKNIDNPDGQGVILAKADTIKHVEEAVAMLNDGASLGAITRRWNDSKVPMRKRRNRKVNVWEYSAIETILRNPVLAGMVPYTPGRQAGSRDSDVLRDESGLPVVIEELAIMTVAEYRQLIENIDKRKMPGTRTNPEQQTFLGLIKCSECGSTMYKARGNGYEYLRCNDKTCPSRGQAISQPNLEAYVKETVIATIGDLPVLQDVTEASKVDEIEQAIADTLRLMQSQATPELFERLQVLQKERQHAGVRHTKVYDANLRYKDLEEWEVLKDVLTVKVHPATKRSNRFQTERVEFIWSGEIESILPALKAS